MKVKDKDGAVCIVTQRTSTSVEVRLFKKSEKGIDCLTVVY